MQGSLSANDCLYETRLAYGSGGTRRAMEVARCMSFTNECVGLVLAVGFALSRRSLNFHEQPPLARTGRYERPNEVTTTERDHELEYASLMWSGLENEDVVVGSTVCIIRERISSIIITVPTNLGRF